MCVTLQIQPLAFQPWYKHFDLEEEETVRYAGDKKPTKTVLWTISICDVYLLHLQRKIFTKNISDWSIPYVLSKYTVVKWYISGNLSFGFSKGYKVVNHNL